MKKKVNKIIVLRDGKTLELTNYPWEYRDSMHWWLRMDDSYIRPLNEFEEDFVNSALNSKYCHRPQKTKKKSSRPLKRKSV